MRLLGPTTNREKEYLGLRSGARMGRLPPTSSPRVVEAGKLPALPDVGEIALEGGSASTEAWGETENSTCKGIPATRCTTSVMVEA
jgi:hypothetical protein